MPTFSNTNDKTAITAISVKILFFFMKSIICLLYTSDAADEEDSVDLGGRRIIKKNKILTVMAVIAVLSFALEKAGIIHP